ncbi:MAG: tetratricopeptide repeat protein, partial [Bacteroidota bacterium]
EAYTAAYFTRGMCYFEQKNFEKAKPNFKSALNINPKHVLSHEKLGIAHFELEEKCEAYKSLKKALDLESQVANKTAREAPRYLGKMTRNPCL